MADACAFALLNLLAETIFMSSHLARVFKDTSLLNSFPYHISLSCPNVLIGI